MSTIFNQLQKLHNYMTPMGSMVSRHEQKTADTQDLDQTQVIEAKIPPDVLHIIMMQLSLKEAIEVTKLF